MQSLDAVGIRYGPTVYADGIHYGRHYYSIRHTTVYMSVYHMLVYAIGRYTLTTCQLGPRPISFKLVSFLHLYLLFYYIS